MRKKGTLRFVGHSLDGAGQEQRQEIKRAIVEHQVRSELLWYSSCWRCAVSDTMHNLAKLDAGKGRRTMCRSIQEIDIGYSEVFSTQSFYSL
jgi:hypothetical protein